MRNTSAVAVACAAVMLASGCGEVRKRIASAEEAQRAAEKRAPELRDRRAALVKEQAELKVKVGEARAKSRSAKDDLRHTLAAAGYLKAVSPGTLAGVDASDAMAMERFEAAAGDPAKVASLVEDATRETRPCRGSPGGENASGCVSTPFDDACADVSEFDSPYLDWKCQELVKHPGSPTLAFCTAEVPSRS